MTLDGSTNLANRVQSHREALIRRCTLPRNGRVYRGGIRRNTVSMNERSNTPPSLRWYIPYIYIFFFCKQLDEVQREIEMDILQRTVLLNHACISGQRLHARIKGARISSTGKKFQIQMKYSVRGPGGNKILRAFVCDLFYCACVRSRARARIGPPDVRERAILRELFICPVS